LVSLVGLTGLSHWLISLAYLTGLSHWLISLAYLTGVEVTHFGRLVSVLSCKSGCPAFRAGAVVASRNGVGWKRKGEMHPRAQLCCDATRAKKDLNGGGFEE